MVDGPGGLFQGDTGRLCLSRKDQIEDQAEAQGRKDEHGCCQQALFHALSPDVAVKNSAAGSSCALVSGVRTWPQDFVVSGGFAAAGDFLLPTLSCSSPDFKMAAAMVF